MKAKTELVMTKVVTKVKLVNPEFGGSGIYQQDDLDEGPIDVYGWMLHTYADGQAVACYQVLNKQLVLVTRAMNRFVVLETEDE